MHCGGIIPPLEHPYDSPYAILHHSPRTFTIQVGARDKIVSISRFKPSTDADDKPDSPRCCSQLPSTGTVAKLATTSRGSPSAPRRVLFSVPWPLHLYIRSSRVNAQEPFFPKPAGGFCMPRAGCFFPASTSVYPSTSRDCPQGSTSDLSSSDAVACEGAVWRSGYAPGPRPAPAGNVLQQVVYSMLLVQ